MMWGLRHQSKTERLGVFRGFSVVEKPELHFPSKKGGCRGKWAWGISCTYPKKNVTAKVTMG